MAKKIAVYFPGLGYHHDKPLLIYSRKLLESLGYESIKIEYRDLPRVSKEDPSSMREAAYKAAEQVGNQLKDYNLAEYDDIIFVGKSIGTIIGAKYASDNGVKVRQILYTPLKETFMFAKDKGIAFIGDKDPFSDINQIIEAADEQNISLLVYKGTNHSLETGDVIRDIEIMNDVMVKTKEYIMKMPSDRFPFSISV